MKLQNQEHELTLLSQLISDASLLDDYKVLEGFFTTSDNKAIFKAIKTLKEKGYDVDYISVCDESKVSATAMTYLDCSITTANFKYYYDSLEELNNLRNLVKINNESLQDINSGKEYSVIVSDIESKLDRIDDYISYDITLVSETIPHVIQDLEDICTGKKDWGIKHGIKSLEKYFIGFMPCQLVIIGARPSCGKTAFMLQLALNISKNNRCGIISLETTKAALIKRQLSNISGVNLKEINHSTRNAFDSLTDACSILYGRKIDIYDPPAATIDDIRLITRRMKKRGCEIVFIDYLTLINNENGNSKTERVADVSTKLKQIARINNIPIVCLSQVKRDAENRRPTMADFVWSGQVEQDADIAIMLHPITNESDPYNVDFEVIVAKQKDGPTGPLTLRFAKEFQRFSEYTSYT